VSDLAAEADAYLRGYTFTERLGQFLAGELRPLVEFVESHHGDPLEDVLRPAAAALRAEAAALRAEADLLESDAWHAG
jgi:hypothetical protein